MKLTKEALKQLIKEEIEKTGVASGKVTPKTQGSLTAQAIEKTKQAFRDGDTCFEGHFPELPILPGVLAIEAFAQTAMAVFLAEHANGEAPNKLGLLLKVNEMAFSEKIVPGRTVEFAIKVDRQVGPFAFVDCKATGEGKKFAIGKIALKIGN